MNKKEYCVGFAFIRTLDGERVVLIRKKKPEWQNGLLNGVGGKVEDGETARQAMAREFSEEAGVHTRAEDWRSVTEMHFLDCVVYCFATVLPDLPSMTPRTMTREEIVVLREGSFIKSGMIPNLLWLVPMAGLVLGNKKQFVPGVTSGF